MIRRVEERPAGWVIIDRRAVDDERLSWAARGLLAYLLARPDDWHVRPAHLATQAGSLYQARQLLRELEAAGYAQLQRARQPDGTFGGSRWVIREDGFHRDPDIPASGADGLPANQPLPNKEMEVNQKSSTTSRDAESRDPGASEAALDAVADAEDAELDSLQTLLTDRGIDAATAGALVDEAPPSAIRHHVERYDAARRDGRVRSVGWLVEALRRNPAAPAAADPLLEPRAAIDYVERRGFSLNATRTLDHYFERVPTDDGLRLRPRREVFTDVD